MAERKRNASPTNHAADSADPSNERQFDDGPNVETPGDPVDSAVGSVESDAAPGEAEEAGRPAAGSSDGESSTSVSDEADWDILMLMQTGPGANGSLLRSVVQDVIQQLGGLSAHREPGSRIDVWLESPGGDAHAAYKLGIYLRSRFEVVNFVIVDYAKSAATLLALAGDSIYMAAAAELGPLDTQESREGETRMRSNLDTANTIDNLYFQIVTNAVAAGNEILRATALSREQTIQHVLEYSAQFARPLLEQIDLVTVNAAATSLDVAIEYGARLLSYRHDRKGLLSAKQRVSQLVRGYPTHGYVIDRDEARDGLGLPVRNIEDYEMLSHVEALYAGAQGGQANIVRIVKASEIKKAMESEGDDVADGGESDGS